MDPNTLADLRPLFCKLFTFKNRISSLSLLSLGES